MADIGAMDLGLAETRVAEVLAARLCHELINPLGAVINGIEILEDDPSFAPDAAQLIAASARQASVRLQFYRLAYGATVELAAGVVERAVLDYFHGGKVTCQWPKQWPEILPSLPWLKAAMNLVVLAADCIPRGGQVAVAVERSRDGGVPRLDVTATGPSARVPDHVAEILADAAVGQLSLGSLTPRTAHGVFTLLLAHRLGGRLHCDGAGPDQVAFRLTLS